jgi:hypothetical protein
MDESDAACRLSCPSKGRIGIAFIRIRCCDPAVVPSYGDDAPISPYRFRAVSVGFLSPLRSLSFSLSHSLSLSLFLASRWRALFTLFLSARIPSVTQYGAKRLVSTLTLFLFGFNFSISKLHLQAAINLIVRNSTYLYADQIIKN